MPYYRNRQGLLAASGQMTMRLSGDAGSHGDPGFKPAPRFASVGDGGIIHDRATGRMWAQDQRLIVPGSDSAAQIQAARGDWQTATAYGLYDLVSRDPLDNGPFYVCLEAHTSGTFADDLAAGKWVETPWNSTAASLPGMLEIYCFSKTNLKVAALDYGGYADWRIPTQLEMVSIVDWERDGYTSDSAWFHSVFGAARVSYWTSNVLASDSDYVSRYTLENEFVMAHQSGVARVLAVRGG